jgi:hypothetical protein
MRGYVLEVLYQQSGGGDAVPVMYGVFASNLSARPNDGIPNLLERYNVGTLASWYGGGLWEDFVVDPTNGNRTTPTPRIVIVPRDASIRYVSDCESMRAIRDVQRFRPDYRRHDAEWYVPQKDVLLARTDAERPRMADVGVLRPRGPPMYGSLHHLVAIVIDPIHVYDMVFRCAIRNLKVHPHPSPLRRWAHGQYRRMEPIVPVVAIAIVVVVARNGIYSIQGCDVGSPLVEFQQAGVMLVAAYRFDRQSRRRGGG